jgi:hypothetical protein
MSSETTQELSSQRPGDHLELGVGSVCCLLHNLIAGGSARQWLRLLGRHVEDGGRATIIAPSGPLSAEARAAGIETVDFDWAELSERKSELEGALAGHDAAIVHWDHQVWDALDPALATCGRAALVLHQISQAQISWLGEEIVPAMRAPLERALDAPHAVALVRGEWHRQRIAAAFDLPQAGFHILPPAIPLPPPTPRSPTRAPIEILALTRISPDKAPIPRLAIELTRAGLDAGRLCRLTVAGEGERRERVIAICEDRLPAEAWRIEGPPEDPIARLADADLIVAQGTTTLEAAALGRPVVVARLGIGGQAAGIVLTPARYDLVARDPFGRLPVSLDSGRLLAEALALSNDQLSALCRLVGRRNSLATGARALAEALATTA